MRWTREAAGSSRHIWLGVISPLLFLGLLLSTLPLLIG